MTDNEKLKRYIEEKTNTHGRLPRGKWRVHNDKNGGICVKCDVGDVFILRSNKNISDKFGLRSIKNYKTFNFMADSHQMVPRLLKCLNEIILLDEHINNEEISPGEMKDITGAWLLFREKILRHLRIDK